MSEYNKIYQLWLDKVTDEELRADLEGIKGNDDEIRSRFEKNLAFGTGGLRGELGAGTNRMNIYTVCRATQGLADYLNEDFESPSVVIGHDSRINSDKFSFAAAEVLAANGIKVCLFKELIPTPIVAYAVSRLKCSSGIVITASHNPCEYNGFKCYDERGYQMTDEAADKTLAFINKCDIFKDIKRISFESGISSGLINILPDDFLDDYYKKVLSRSVNPEICRNSDLSVIYTPLNGTGNKPVRKILELAGFKNVTVVPSQENPDGKFPTCPKPNPEIPAAFNEAFKIAEAIPADLLLGTDPDCDRVGIAVHTKEGYKLLSGNDVGCLLVDYILSQKKTFSDSQKKPVIIKSIVSTKMADDIALSYNAEVFNVLTGFKYIGELMHILEEKGEGDRFQLGFEESYGYLTGMHTKDKDAVNGALLICEMAAYYKSLGINLVEAMNSLYERFGYWKNSLYNFEFKSVDGMDRMLAVMASLRESYPVSIGGEKVSFIRDYLTQIETNISDGTKTAITLPVSNVIEFETENSGKLFVRPSGTEPKLKLYIMAKGNSSEEASDITDKYASDMKTILNLND